ncbi:hypothetical protein LguiB_009467 [Lonicera macranthoides]
MEEKNYLNAYFTHFILAQISNLKHAVLLLSFSSAPLLFSSFSRRNRCRLRYVFKLLSSTEDAGGTILYLPSFFFVANLGV